MRSSLPTSEWTLSGQSPLACCKIPLESLFRTVHVCCTYIVYLLYILAYRFNSFFFFVKLSISFKCLFSLNFQLLNNIVQLLYNYCSIIVQYSYPGNVFQVFRSCKEVTTPATQSSKHQYKYKTFLRPSLHRIFKGLLPP
jgi:hypothetical protein